MNRCPLDDGGSIGPTTSVPHAANGHDGTVGCNGVGGWLWNLHVFGTCDTSLPCCLGNPWALMANRIVSHLLEFEAHLGTELMSAAYPSVYLFHCLLGLFCLQATKPQLIIWSTVQSLVEVTHIAWLFFSTPYVCEVLPVIPRVLNIKKTVQSVIWTSAQVVTLTWTFFGRSSRRGPDSYLEVIRICQLETWGTSRQRRLVRRC